MQDSIARIVHATLQYGLCVRDQLEAGAPLTLETVQARLQDMLAPLETEEIWEASEQETPDLDFSGAIHQEARAQMSQATIRYALLSWLDELFQCYSPWAHRWKEQTLEGTLAGNPARTQVFWEEARYAEVRGDVAALEVLYWCVLLGYRGPWRQRPDLVESWVGRMRATLDQTRELTPVRGLVATPDGDALRTHQALSSERPFQRMAFTVLVTLSLLIPGGLLVYWRH